jgi:hypothetical protein
VRSANRNCCAGLQKPIPSATYFTLRDPLSLMIGAMHQANYATIADYPASELRYMDAGERGPKARAGQEVTPGYQ